MFTPPRCPHARCRFHEDPPERWFRRKGSYRAQCRAHRVPRFECRGCGKGFSRQTFRADYHDKKPWANALLLKLLVSGVGYRQSARMLGLHLDSVYGKARKLSLQLLHGHRNMVAQLKLEKATLLLDEMETFEGSRRARPLTLPAIIERETCFVLAADADTLPARGRLRAQDERTRQRDEERHGRRRNRSSRVTGRLLKLASRVCLGPTRLVCDQKRTYPILARRAFGEDRVEIEQHSSRLVRNTMNPLFFINLTEAMARDLSGRLRRQSWLASKERRALRIALAIFCCYRNYVRPRFNRDAGKDVRTPAQMLGLCRRPLRFEDLSGWRQDWGPRSMKLRNS